MPAFYGLPSTVYGGSPFPSRPVTPMTRIRAMRTLENALRRLGFHRIAGVDEVGRGCLAGPVMAGAVVLDPARHIPALSDSKQIGAPERERLGAEIVARSAAWAIGVAEADEIDRIEVVRSARVRRAKLYFLRNLRGKAARMRETTKRT